jgi:hypothetical protein
MQRKKPTYVSNGLLNVPDIRIDYNGFVIVPKLDFGGGAFFIKGTKVMRGYIVSNGGITNVMPGATWFQSIIEARVAVDILTSVGGNSQLFWLKLRGLQGLEEYEDV